MRRPSLATPAARARYHADRAAMWARVAKVLAIVSVVNAGVAICLAVVALVT